MTIGILYIGLLGGGLVFALISGLAGWISDIDGGEIHVDSTGHLDAGHPSPISGTVVATFVTGFGAGGTLAHYLLDWPLVGSLSTAMGTGLAMGAAAFGILELLFRKTEAGAEFAVEESVGRDCEVITPIPAGGMGEVAYFARGQREMGAARSVDGEAIPRGTLVVIDQVSGPTLFVRRKN